MLSNILGGEVDPIPEVLFFYVAADQLGDQGLLGQEVCAAFVGVGWGGFVGGDGELKLGVEVDAGPLEEEDAAAVERTEVVVAEDVVYGYRLFWVFVAGDVEVGQELEFALTRRGEFLLKGLVVLGQCGLQFTLNLLGTVLLDLDLVVDLLILVPEQGYALIE